MMSSEAQLIQLARQGDTLAVERLFRPYQNGIFRYLVHMLQDRALAEDATQETLIQCMKGLKKYQEQGNFKAWIYTIARHEGLLVIRRRKKRQEHEVAMDETIEPSADMKNDLGELDGYIQQLPALEKETLLLRVDEGLSFKEIAQMMECSINTALGRMHNATKRLKGWMQEEGVS